MSTARMVEAMARGHTENVEGIAKFNALYVRDYISRNRGSYSKPYTRTQFE